MDISVVEESAAPARVVLRNQKGTILGALERQRLTGKVVARSLRGIVVGVYDPYANETRDSHGRLVGRGNLLGALLLRVR